MTSVHESLINVMIDVDHVGKTGINRQGGGYNFRGIDAVVNAVGPAFRRHKVLAVPRVIEYHYGEILSGSNRTPMGHARVIVEYTFHGSEGDSITCSAPGEAFDSGDKATAKAMSVAFRTALIQALALPTDEPDPDESSYNRAVPILPSVEAYEFLQSSLPDESPHALGKIAVAALGKPINEATEDEWAAVLVKWRRDGVDLPARDDRPDTNVLHRSARDDDPPHDGDLDQAAAVAAEGLGASEVRMITRGQSKKLHAMLGAFDAKLKDREARLGFLSSHVKRTLGSSDDLTWDEAEDLFATLDKAIKDKANEATR